MKIGDEVLFYQSNTDPNSVVGYCKVVKETYTDHTQFDPDNKHYFPKANPENPPWVMVDIKLVKMFKNRVTLSAIKENYKLKDMKLVQRGNRLSVMPVTNKEFDEILKMAK